LEEVVFCGIIRITKKLYKADELGEESTQGNSMKWPD